MYITGRAKEGPLLFCKHKTAHTGVVLKILRHTILIYTLLFRPFPRSFPRARHHLWLNAITLERSIETLKSTINPSPSIAQSSWTNLFLNDSTSSFRYPCLVHVFPLCRHKAWTISSSSLAILNTSADAMNLFSLQIDHVIWWIRISANNQGQLARSDYE